MEPVGVGITKLFSSLLVFVYNIVAFTSTDSDIYKIMLYSLHGSRLLKQSTRLFSFRSLLKAIKSESVGDTYFGMRSHNFDDSKI